MGSSIFGLCITLVCLGKCFGFNFHDINTLPPTRISRRTSYNPIAIKRTCYLKPDVGPCRGDIPMFYYDPNKNECSNFKWGGCQGNGNRFDSEEECKAYCLSPPNYERGRPEYCSLTFDYGFCFGAIDRWYYDSLWKVCKKGLYSGCGGNKNNFKIEEQCRQVCSFGKPSLGFATKRSWDGHKKVLIINPFEATTRHEFKKTERSVVVLGSTTPVIPSAGGPTLPSAGTNAPPPSNGTVSGGNGGGSDSNGGGSGGNAGGNTAATQNVKVLRYGETPQIWMGRK